MKKLIQILSLKIKIYSLKKKRKEVLLGICVRRPNDVSRVGDVERLMHNFFVDIDKKIRYNERLINIISNK